MIDKLSAKKVVIIDFQEPYSAGLADAAQVVLRARNVEVIRLSTSVRTTDFSSLVTRHRRRGQSSCFRRRQPPPRRRWPSSCSSRASGQWCSAPMARFSPSQYKLAGSYVSNFAPDLS